jgi:hypothetical protein
MNIRVEPRDRSAIRLATEIKRKMKTLPMKPQNKPPARVGNRRNDRLSLIRGLTGRQFQANSKPKIMLATAVNAPRATVLDSTFNSSGIWRKPLKPLITVPIRGNMRSHGRNNAATIQERCL